MGAPADPAAAARDRPRWWTRFRRRERVADRAPGDIACRNCGTDAPGAYCPACGQETTLRLPTAGQFMRDAAGRYVAFDGRMWRTLVPLLLRPGSLTREYLAGRRRRYVRPARLVLVLAILMFAVVRFATDPVSMIDLRDAGPEGDAPASSAPSATTSSATTSSASTAPASTAPASIAPATPPAAVPPAPPKDRGLSLSFGPPDRAATRARVIEGDTPAAAMVARGLEIDDSLNLRWRNLDSPFGQAIERRLEAFNRLDRDAKAEAIAGGMVRYGPYALIGLLPAFALLLQAVYLFPRAAPSFRPRRYSEHLVFAAHNHAFLALAGTLLPFLSWTWAIVALAAWVVAYLPLSLRRAYGGGWFGVLARSAVVTIAYMGLFALELVALLAAAIVLR